MPDNIETVSVALLQKLAQGYLSQQQEINKLHATIVAIQATQLISIASLSEANAEVFSVTMDNLESTLKKLENECSPLPPEMSTYLQKIIDVQPGELLSVMQTLLQDIPPSEPLLDGDFFQ